jgi:hypothetical protein
MNSHSFWNLSQSSCSNSETYKSLSQVYKHCLQWNTLVTYTLVLLLWVGLDMCEHTSQQYNLNILNPHQIKRHSSGSAVLQWLFTSWSLSWSLLCHCLFYKERYQYAHHKWQRDKHSHEAILLKYFASRTHAFMEMDAHMHTHTHAHHTTHTHIQPICLQLTFKSITCAHFLWPQVTPISSTFNFT